MKFDEVSIYWIRDLKRIRAHYAYHSLIQGISVGYIPGQPDIRPVTSRGRGQCLNGAEEVPRAKPEALPRRNEALHGLSQGM